jgi:integrase
MPDQQHPRRIPVDAAPATVSNDQLRQILSISYEDPSLRDLHEIASLVSYTGIRPGELQNLRWSRVDVPKCRAFVATKRVRGHYVPLGPKALQILEARRGRAPESEYVLGASGRRLLNQISRQLRALGNSIGASAASLSTLRRTFITRLAYSATDPTSVMIICGYRDSYLPPKFLSNPTHHFERAARELAPLLEKV